MIHKFIHNGVEHEIPRDMAEAIYRSVLLEYRIEDAKGHLEQFIYGDDRDELTQFDRQYREIAFFDKYKMSTEDATGLLGKIVDRFEKDLDCNQNENDQWTCAILNTLNGI